MSNPIGLKAGDTVVYRYGDAEALTVIESNDCIVIVRDGDGETFPIAIGNIRAALTGAKP